MHISSTTDPSKNFTSIPLENKSQGLNRGSEGDYTHYFYFHKNWYLCQSLMFCKKTITWIQMSILISFIPDYFHCCYTEYTAGTEDGSCGSRPSWCLGGSSFPEETMKCCAWSRSDQHCLLRPHRSPRTVSCTRTRETHTEVPRPRRTFQCKWRNFDILHWRYLTWEK